MKRYIVAGSIVMMSYGLTAVDPVTSHTLAPTPSLSVGIPALPESEEKAEIQKVHMVYETNTGVEMHEDGIAFNEYNVDWTASEKHRKAEEALSSILFGECRGQSIYCMTAVGHVAMNRARLDLDKRYGKGLWGVINKNKQFSCLNKNDPSYKVIKKAIAGKLKPGTKDAEKWKMAKDVAHILMHRAEADPTLGATHYHATWMIPKWVKDRGMVKTVSLDGHHFYRKEG